MTKRFRARTGWVEAVRGISFGVQRGEVLAFLGPNGAGKSTTIKMTAGLIRPDRGSILLDGLDVSGRPAQAAAALGAVLEGSRNLYWRLTALENLIYWGTLRRLRPAVARHRAVELLELVGLAERSHNTVQTLSRGMQQKLALCQALMHRPSLLLLDEPTLGLDFASGQAIKTTVRALAREGVAILLTTHQLDLAQELSDRVAIIRRGAIALQGQTADVLAAYSRPVWRVTAAEKWPTAAVERAAALAEAVELAAPDELVVSLPGGRPDAIYRLLSALEPVPLRSVQQHRADLAEVFQRVVADEEASG